MVELIKMIWITRFHNEKLVRYLKCHSGSRAGYWNYGHAGVGGHAHRPSDVWGRAPCEITVCFNRGAMTELTQILSQIETGDVRASEQLLPLVYDELRKLAAAKMAQESPGQTLQATAVLSASQRAAPHRASPTLATRIPLCKAASWHRG